MVLVLCIGDLHIPHRATDLPLQFRKLLVPGKIHHTLCTGNIVTKEIYDYLRTVCSDLTVAKGEFDEDISHPDSKVLKVGDFKVGLLHGHQVVPAGSKSRLGFIARQMDVDILVTGGTHEFKVSLAQCGTQSQCFGSPVGLAITEAACMLHTVHRASLAERMEGRLLINPGSATGACSVFNNDVVPSFVLMDINGSKAILYVYELKDGEVSVTKTEHPDPAA